VLQANGSEHALVVYGHDGLDELTTTGPSTVHELRDGAVLSYTVDPALLGLAPASRSALQGGDAATNAARARAVLQGESGPQRDIVVLNAAAALVVAGVAGSIAEGLADAAAAIDRGAALGILDELVRVSCAAVPA
jgi:anthranilate phosphoribosyltransferase